ncbi:MAG: site-2 protease family protein [bacterium]|nr:site-2 protease family protein [bacterium]
MNGDELPYKDVTPPKESRRLPVLLFFLTGLTTTFAGALQRGINPMAEPLGFFKGLPFSVTLLAILMVHEISHFLSSRAHGVPSTLPFFIPAPSIIGTFGAVIRMKGAIWDRRALLDIGASGPIGGFILALPALILGFAMSEVVPGGGLGEGGLVLGDSILVAAVGRIILGEIPAGADVILHPVAFAGWIGMFVTSLNLLPVGQLDGGHISTAMFPRHSITVARVVHFSLLFMGVFFWEGWLIWALFLVFIGVRHPPVLLPHITLDRKRVRIGYAALVIFVLTFVPAPFKII